MGECHQVLVSLQAGGEVHCPAGKEQNLDLCTREGSVIFRLCWCTKTIARPSRFASSPAGRVTDVPADLGMAPSVTGTDRLRCSPASARLAGGESIHPETQVQPRPCPGRIAPKPLPKSDTDRSGRHGAVTRRGLRPASFWVGVAGFEPPASSSRIRLWKADDLWTLPEMQVRALVCVGLAWCSEAAISRSSPGFLHRPSSHTGQHDRPDDRSTCTGLASPGSCTRRT